MSEPEAAAPAPPASPAPPPTPGPPQRPPPLASRGPPPAPTASPSPPPTPGSRLRAARIACGFTQHTLADTLRVSRSAIAQWETDRAGQVHAHLQQLCAVLGVSVEYLLHGDDKRAPAQAASGDELALLRLYRECAPEDRQALLQLARRLARSQAPADPG
jgi:transcriptional regulator with XRE-family HTH domain